MHFENVPKILHTAKYSGLPMTILKEACPQGFVVKTLEEASYEQLLKEAVDADYFLVSGRLPIDEGVLSAAKHLKMIQRTGVGTEMLDMEAVRKHNIPVYVNAGVNARSVAEHTLTLMLCCLKNIPLIDKNVKQGIWKKQQTGVTCNELFGKYEDSLGKYLGPYRTISQIIGKGGIPTHKEDGLRIDVYDAGAIIQEKAESGKTEIDENGKRFIFCLERQPYIPINVYKTFIIMAQNPCAM